MICACVARKKEEACVREGRGLAGGEGKKQDCGGVNVIKVLDVVK